MRPQGPKYIINMKTYLLLDSSYLQSCNPPYARNAEAYQKLLVLMCTV